MFTTNYITLQILCPALGTIMANIMFFAPYKDFQRAMQRVDLGDLNPTPWIFMLGNCFGWVIYGILLQNLWIFFANIFGFILSIWLNLGAAKLLHQGQYTKQICHSLIDYFEEHSSTSIESLEKGEQLGKEKIQNIKEGRSLTNDTAQSNINKNTIIMTRDRVNNVMEASTTTILIPTPHENIMMVVVIVWILCVSTIAFVPSLSASTKEFVIGLVVNLNLVFFYGAPLSTILEIIRERNRSSIHIPTMITNTLNGSFWTAYGIAIGDYWIIVPNSLGAALGVIQIILCLLLPKNQHQQSVKDETKIIQHEGA